MLSKLQRSGAAAKVVGLVNGTRHTVVIRYVDVEKFYDDMRLSLVRNNNTVLPPFYAARLSRHLVLKMGSIT